MSTWKLHGNGFERGRQMWHKVIEKQPENLLNGQYRNKLEMWCKTL